MRLTVYVGLKVSETRVQVGIIIVTFWLDDFANRFRTNLNLLPSYFSLAALILHIHTNASRRSGSQGFLGLLLVWHHRVESGISGSQLC